MEEWKEYKLGDVCTMIPGFAFKSKDFGIGKDIAIKIKDIRPPFVETKEADNVDTSNYNQKKLSKFVVHKGEFLLAMTGATIGKIGKYICEEPAYVNQRVLKFEDAGFILYDYLYYYLSTDVFQSFITNHIDSQSAQPNISSTTIGKYPIKVPSIKVQKQIVSILKSLDDKIEVNRKINENLEQQAQALFKSWFVDFEPFKNGEFVESELGRIPKGWRVYTMEELVDRVGGYSYKGNELQESTTAMATIKNFERNGGFKINGFKEIVPSSKAKHEQFLKKFDVIIAHTDLTQNADIIGNPALILHFGKYDRLIMSMDLVKVKSKSDYITYGLLYCFFSDARFKSHALGYVNGTTVLHLSKKAIPDYKLALPNDLSILAKFGKTFDSIFAKEAEMMEETDRLATLRDTLLPKLMSGELKVNEIDDIL